MAVGLKKFFMNEWTGKLDVDAHNAIQRALASTPPDLEEELAKVRAQH